MSVLSTYFIWNELLVPLWSRSCERQATRRANFSSGVNNFPNSSTCNPKYQIVEKKKTNTNAIYNRHFLLWKHVMFIRALSSFLFWGCHYLIWNHKMVARTKKWITTLRMVNIVWATLNACLQLWYITGR